jgi:hypothetical protein
MLPFPCQERSRVFYDDPDRRHFKRDRITGSAFQIRTGSVPGVVPAHSRLPELASNTCRVVVAPLSWLEVIASRIGDATWYRSLVCGLAFPGGEVPLRSGTGNRSSAAIAASAAPMKNATAEAVDHLARQVREEADRARREDRGGEPFRVRGPFRHEMPLPYITGRNG